jgi:8-oxo-dGTP diphosphatase
VNAETPKVAVDVVVYHAPTSRIAVIERKYPPLGYALPGGFIDVGEQVEHAAHREIREELNVKLDTLQFLGYYDDPARDPRKHVISFAFVGICREIPRAGDDAKTVTLVYPDVVLATHVLCFDHARIIKDARDRGMIP